MVRGLCQLCKHSPAVAQQEEVVPPPSHSLLLHWTTVEDIAILGRACPPRVKVCDCIVGIADDLQCIQKGVLF